MIPTPPPYTNSRLCRAYISACSTAIDCQLALAAAQRERCTLDTLKNFFPLASAEYTMYISCSFHIYLRKLYVCIHSSGSKRERARQSFAEIHFTREINQKSSSSSSSPLPLERRKNSAILRILVMITFGKV